MSSDEPAASSLPAEGPPQEASTEPESQPVVELPQQQVQSPPDPTPAPKKRAGRPAGSKNKPKVVRVPVAAAAEELPIGNVASQQQARSSSEAALQQKLASEVIAAIAPIASPQINLTDTLRETLRKLHLERKQKQSALYANLALSGLR